MVRDFTSIIASISTRGEGRLFLFGKEIFVFTNEANDMWQIATKVSPMSDSKNESKNNSDLREFLSYSFTTVGSLAIKDYAGRGVYFLYDVPAANRYVLFQKVIKAYLEEADCWTKIFS